MVTIGVVIAGAGLTLLSQIHSLWQFYVAFLTIALGSSFGGFMAISATVANWFRRMRSRAMGIAMAGMSMGGLLVPLVAWFLANYGWRRTAFVSGLVIIAVAVPLAQILRHTPEKQDYLPNGAGSPSRESDSTPAAPEDTLEGGDPYPSLTAKEALKTPAFWFLSLGHAASLLVVSSLGLHLIPHIVQRLDVSVQMAGIMVSLMTAVMIFSQVFGGALGDRINKRLGLTVCLLGHAAALLGLAFSYAVWQVALSVVVYGLSWGTRGPMLMSLRADYFGRASYATIMGFSSLITMIGMTVGPLFAGNMADRLGSYQLAFIILASVAGVGSVFFLLARRPQMPRRLREEA
jgi:MFS family permease